MHNPHVTRNFQEWLHEQKHEFIDASGNAWMAGEGCTIWVEGRRSHKVPQADEPKRTSRAFTATGLRVVFVLLVSLELVGAPVRTISEAAGVSIGAVSNVLKDLD
ncbi:MAG: hypothetical protein Q3965_02500 [Rothia sp. (in: high G+C Gram-positive bacteria)]|nr:hypothetical protein [Rothia sp. (in: high G+C Gram-positive bacteria)]